MATTPGAPAERVAALRKAYRDMLRDPEFVAEAARLKLEIGAMTGEELAQLVRDLIGAPQDVRDCTKLAIQPKSADTTEIKLDKNTAK